jgi:molybdate transport system substrate-binding protein
MNMNIHLLSGGAANAAVTGVQDDFEKETGCAVQATFSAVGAMHDQLISGTPCDLVILTRPLIDKLIASGHVVAGSAQSLGRVKTGIAVRTGEQHPDVGTREALTAALRAAKGIYFPDPAKATAGIHFLNVLKALGLDQELSAAFRVYPNGATAMQAMADSAEPGLIGCTQVTEINYTPGVDLVANLPHEFELATDYTLGICNQAQQPELAQKLAVMLTGPASAAMRKQGGFEF